MYFERFYGLFYVPQNNVSHYAFKYIQHYNLQIKELQRDRIEQTFKRIFGYKWPKHSHITPNQNMSVFHTSCSERSIPATLVDWGRSGDLTNKVKDWRKKESRVVDSKGGIIVSKCKPKPQLVKCEVSPLGQKSLYIRLPSVNDELDHI